MKIDLYRWQEVDGPARKGQTTLFINGHHIPWMTGWKLEGQTKTFETLTVDLIGQIKIHDTAPPKEDTAPVERCGTCKHWARLPLSHPQAVPKGTCGLLRAVEISVEGAELREVQDADVFNLDQPHLVTRRGFGCAAWEGKTDDA